MRTKLITHGRIGFLAVTACVLLLVWLFAQTVQAQTQIPLDRQATISNANGTIVLVWIEGVGIRPADLGAGITVTQQGSKWIISATASTPVWRTEQVIVSQDAPDIQLLGIPRAGSLTVARNGLLQWDQDDYALVGQTVQLPHAATGDRVIFRYQVNP